MPVALTKIQNGNPALSDDLKNEQIVKCPRCERTYRLGYSDTEWHRVKDWLQLAAKAIRKEHDLRHEAATIPLGVAWHTETVSGLTRRGSRMNDELGVGCRFLTVDADPKAIKFYSDRGFVMSLHKNYRDK